MNEFGQKWKPKCNCDNSTDHCS